jgi:3-mercaptopyruvate sulfurtransferase SseA
MIQIPRLLEPQDLEHLIHDERLIIVDLSNHALYQQKHVPGAVHLRGNTLVAGTGPTPGKNPAKRLSSISALIRVNMWFYVTMRAVAGPVDWLGHSIF